VKPLCFVLMPFGSKPAASGRLIDFDSVYSKAIRPAVEAGGMEPIRADEEWVGGLIHKPMFERLLLCDYAIADLTTANANVFYELGVRHAVRPHTTLLIFAEGERLPFDVAAARGLAYQLSSTGRTAKTKAFIAAVTAGLEAARTPAVDSPIYQLIGDWPELSDSKADAFRDRALGASDLKAALARARSKKIDDEKAAAVRAIEDGIDVGAADAAVLIDLMLSFRAASAWNDVVRLIESMPAPIRSQTMVREQLGMALNRAHRNEEAESVLQELIEARGASPETCGILGRVYKDRYLAARADHRDDDAHGFRTLAIATYLRGFEVDWRDAYPGINAAQLIHAANPADPRLGELIPVVTYAVRRKIAAGNVDYWDHATLLELAVLGGDEGPARAALADARAAASEPWMLDTTAQTLDSIVDRGGPAWVGDLALGLRAGRG